MLLTPEVRHALSVLSNLSDMYHLQTMHEFFLEEDAPVGYIQGVPVWLDMHYRILRIEDMHFYVQEPSHVAEYFSALNPSVYISTKKEILVIPAKVMKNEAGDHYTVVLMEDLPPGTTSVILEM